MKLAGEKGRSPERPSSRALSRERVTSHCAMKCRADVPCRPTPSSDGEAGWSSVPPRLHRKTSSLSSLSSADQRPRDIEGLQ